MPERAPPSRGAHDLLLIVGLAAGMLGLTLVSAGVLQSPAATRLGPREPSWRSSPEGSPTRREADPRGTTREAHTRAIRPLPFTAIKGHALPEVAPATSHDSESDLRAVMVGAEGEPLGPGNEWDLRRELTELAYLQRRRVHEPVPGHYATRVLAPALGLDRQLPPPASAREITSLP